MHTVSLVAFCAILISFVTAQPKRGDKFDVLNEEWCGEYNCYEILEVTPDSDFKFIKSRYNNLSLELHPDKNKNATDSEKARYVRINKAYEILSSKRRDYDEYLRIKASLDSPIESPILVLILLYLGIAYVVLYYQRQQQQQCKDAILKDAQVIRYYWDEKRIDLTGKKKVGKSPRGKGKKNKSKNGTTKSLCEIKEEIKISDLNDVIAKLNLVVPGWKDTEPTYKQAMFDVFKSILWGFGKVIFQLRWVVKYKILKQDYTDSDKEYVCRTYHKKTEIQWNAMPEQDRQKLLNKRGPWNRSKNMEDERDNKKKKKRN